MPEDFDIKKATSIGLSILWRIMGNYKGWVAYKSDNGTSVDKELPRENYFSGVNGENIKKGQIMIRLKMSEEATRAYVIWIDSFFILFFNKKPLPKNAENSMI